MWSLGAVIFSLLGVNVALSSHGVWYSVVSAIILFLAGAVFAARAVLSVRSNA
jgi:hypothetical protein